MEEKLKNKKLKLNGKQICELIIDLALDDKERKNIISHLLKRKR